MNKVVDFYTELRLNLLEELRSEIRLDFEKQKIINLELKNKINGLETEITRLKTDSNELNNKVIELESKRNESYYQRFLERKLSGTHKRTKFGITDITTDKEHIEIKHWKNYKAALGQLLSYNHHDNKILSVYFFGTIDDKQRENIIELYSSKGVNINELIDTLDGIQIREVKRQIEVTKIEPENEMTNFYNWLSNCITFEKDSYMCLEEICYAFTGESNLNTFSKQKYRIEILME